MNNRPEILAPAGAEEQLIAAVRSGADAVYLGTENFNARSSAQNFTAEELKAAVAYCHARNVKVYVTMNTLVTDSEIPDVINEIKKIAASSADAVIIQDLAVARLFREYCPDMPLHASTQMTIHNTDGVKFAQKLGFKRVVPARELSADETKKIISETDAETEVFVHGAQCMSISGTCLLSSVIGARSGNRGKCAQPCRLNFKCGEREYALSLKDLSLTEYLTELADMGVSSFKIEGRMKRPEYAAAAVKAVKSKLSGGEFDTEMLKAVFSRSGFTQGYFNNKRTLDMFGYRQKEDVTAAAGVLNQLKNLYKDEISCIPIKMNFSLNESFAALTVTDGANTVNITENNVQKAISKPLSKETAEKSLSKTGGTIFFPDEIICTIQDGLTLSASQINSMRRAALNELYEKRSTLTPVKTVTPPKKPIFAVSRTEKPAVRLSFERFSQSFDDDRCEKIILPVSEIIKHPEAAEIYASKLIARLPAVIFPSDEEHFSASLLKLGEMGITDVSADNCGTFEAAKNAGFKVHGSSGLNILNSVAADEYYNAGIADITVSPELNMSLIKKMSCKAKTGIVAYGFLPLMRLRACPAQSNNGCGDCKGLTVITDRIGTRFYLLCSQRKYTTLLNSVPLYIGDKNLNGIDFAILSFTFEKTESCKKILDAFCSKENLPVKKTGGLYYRELL